ncbi:hypothetical protein OSB04_006626 [Centaurea solstitialis]|uniref:Uncharacterized protein n=1 Tax=Centaurea solstitialis TaxID=347529 RepID=A0AA38TW35_9ASTR|nr:hypothetical protein OSB04_006626 [Centaurea solstitialis]
MSLGLNFEIPIRIAQPWEIGSFSLVNRRIVVKFEQRLHDSSFFNLTGGIEHRRLQLKEVDLEVRCGNLGCLVDNPRGRRTGGIGRLPAVIHLSYPRCISGLTIGIRAIVLVVLDRNQRLFLLFQQVPESDHHFPKWTLVSRFGTLDFPIRISSVPESELIHFPIWIICLPNRISSLSRFGNLKSPYRNSYFPNRDLGSDSPRKLCPIEKHHLLKTDPVSEDVMSKEIISIGSETRPPVLVVGEYQQWKRRMINFLDLLDDKLMVLITEGPIRPTVTVAEVARTDVTPYLPAYEV